MKNLLKKLEWLFANESRMAADERELYLKYIQNFSVPSEEPNRIGIGIEGLKEYDLVDTENKNQIGGHLNKRFVRLHNRYFPKLIDDLKTAQTDSYVTYFDEGEALETGLVPTNLSVLIKDYGTMMFELSSAMQSECLAPKIMDFFGCKTAYNEHLVKDYRQYVFSLDFIKPGERFYTGFDLSKVHFKPPFKLEPIVQNLHEELLVLRKEIEREYGVKNVKIDEERIINEYVYTYLVRAMLMGDRDFGKDENHGFIYNKTTKTVTFSAGFDYEVSFDMPLRTHYYLMQDLEFIYKNHYEVFESFVSRVNDFKAIDEKTKNPVFADIVFANTEDPSLAKNYNFLLFENSGEIVRKFYEVGSSALEAEARQK